VSSLNGRSIVDGSNITVKFTAEGLGGYSGCNWYGARYSVTGNKIRIDSPESTTRGCSAPPGVGQQEAAYFEALRQVVAFRAVSDRLELTSSADEVTLVLVPRRRYAMNPAHLVGTHWRLRSVNDTALASDSTLTLELTATEMRGFAGCRWYTGTYLARSDEIHVTSLTMDATECNRGRAAWQREGQFTTDLSEATYYRLRGDSLELVTVGGRRLVFSARR
jgi:heat shock protein HslJ